MSPERKVLVQIWLSGKPELSGKRKISPVFNCRRSAARSPAKNNALNSAWSRAETKIYEGSKDELCRRRKDQPGEPVPPDEGQFLTLTVPLLHLPGTFLPFCTPLGCPPLEEAASRDPYAAWQKCNATSLSRHPLFQMQGAWDSYRRAVNSWCARTVHNQEMNKRFTITFLPYINTRKAITSEGRAEANDLGMIN